MDRTYGIQTILMTDVVGSTRLWAAHPHTMPLAVERLERLAVLAVEAEGGRVLKRRGEGDSLFCLLPNPASAARAAASLVRALAAESSSDGLSLIVRAAVHCGPAHVRDEDIFGPVPNRCGRLREVAHGGQILLTGAARGQIGAADGIAVRELGRHRLRDLDEPESIAQVLGEGLPAEFPPLRSLTSLRNNLPLQTTSFVGREALRRDLLERLKTDRLTTVTGAGGCGKTRLSLQLGADTIDQFPDGVWFVELAEVGEEPAIVRAIGEACGFRDLPDGDVRALADRLRGQALFLLDNAEHALSPIGRVVAALLAAAPDLRFVVTSREPLRLRGERVHRVPPLSVPPPGCADPDEVAATEAGALFLDRARLHLPEFVVRASNALSIGEIARRLDGIPLCLEMAASHVGYLGTDQIAARLNDRFALLEGDDADAPVRHRTMRETIAWQYDGLSYEEKILLQRLAVFAGGFTLDAAEAVGGTPPLDPDRVLRLLRALVDKSLVVATPDGGGMRYRLLETIAQFSMERSEGEAEAAMPALLDWAVAFAQRSYVLLGEGRTVEVVDGLDIANGSLDRALAYGFATNDVRACQLALRLTRYWDIRGRFGAARTAVDRALRLCPSGEFAMDLLNAAGVFSTRVGDYVAAEGHYRDLLQHPDLSLAAQARALANLAIVENEIGRREAARVHYEEAHALAIEADNQALLGLVRFNLALHLADDSDPAAEPMIDALLEEHERLGDDGRRVACLEAKAYFATVRNEYNLVAKYLSSVLDNKHEIRHEIMLSDVLLDGAWLASQVGDQVSARQLFNAHHEVRGDMRAPLSPRNASLARIVEAQLGMSTPGALSISRDGALDLLSTIITKVRCQASDSA